jgi:hypothetical protein
MDIRNREIARKKLIVRELKRQAITIHAKWLKENPYTHSVDVINNTPSYFFELKGLIKTDSMTHNIYINPY